LCRVPDTHIRIHLIVPLLQLLLPTGFVGRRRVIVNLREAVAEG
jgi:hypothetical protein